MVAPKTRRQFWHYYQVIYYKVLLPADEYKHPPLFSASSKKTRFSAKEPWKLIKGWCKDWNILPDRSPSVTYIATNCFVFTGWHRILPLQQAAQIQIDLVLFDLSQQENFNHRDKDFRKYFPVHAQWFVAAICCCSQGVVGCQNVLQQHVIYCVPVHPGFDSKPEQNKWTNMDWTRLDQWLPLCPSIFVIYMVRTTSDKQISTRLCKITGYDLQLHLRYRIAFEIKKQN